MAQTYRPSTQPKPAPITHLQPIGDRLIVKPHTPEQETASGIVIVRHEKERPHQGTIIAAGEGRLDDNGNVIPLRVAVGDEVLFTKFAGTEFAIDDITHIIIGERDVLAVVKN